MNYTPEQLALIEEIPMLSAVCDRLPKAFATGYAMASDGSFLPTNSGSFFTVYVRKAFDVYLDNLILEHLKAITITMVDPNKPFELSESDMATAFNDILRVYMQGGSYYGIEEQVTSLPQELLNQATMLGQELDGILSQLTLAILGVLKLKEPRQDYVDSLTGLWHPAVFQSVQKAVDVVLASLKTVGDSFPDGVEMPVSVAEPTAEA